MANLGRVQLLVGSGTGWFKPGQFGIVQAINKSGGMHLVDKSRESRVGESAILVAKSPRSGAIWFSEDAVRFTRARKKKPSGGAPVVTFRDLHPHKSADQIRTEAWLRGGPPLPPSRGGKY
jgi:hypothetical protein